ncbi:MAG: L-2-hydroxyglutarate oxidase [Desulfomonile tiedjei]|nr:L-2-hydroxyglutarate oxidase [Desulfomonile tiedjei]
MTTNTYSVAIIGGGIVGCALARELGKRFSNVLLPEKESAVGCHTSGRNSGVVHSGFNPKPGTLKAGLCIEGSNLMRQFCKERGVACEQVGTYVVALVEAQIPLLYDLKSRGEKNGVPGLEILPIDVVREREPNVKGLKALFSPTGSIVDSKALVHTIARDAQDKGVDVLTGQEVSGLSETAGHVELRTSERSYRVALMMNCAGLHADRLAHMMGVGRDYVIAPFRGEYFVVQRPVPHPLVPFLGVHLTKSIDGSVLLGPNAVPAFGREAYGRWNVNIRDIGQMPAHRGVWTALVRNRTLVRIAWNEWRHSRSRRHFWKEASRLVDGLRPSDLTLGRRVGIRPQLIRANGHLVEDLSIETTPRSVHILNVVSPGMTSSLAFARWASSRIDEGLRWKALEDQPAEVMA